MCSKCVRRVYRTSVYQVVQGAEVTDKYTPTEKIEKLLELVPDLPECNARVMLGYTTGEDWIFTRLSIIEAAEIAMEDIESGVAFTKLYKALR